MALAQVLSGCANGGTAQPSVTSPSFSPGAAANIVIIMAGCYASTGDDSSTIAISDSLGSTWTPIQILSQAADGASSFPPQPTAAWYTTGSAAARTVTTSIVSGVGFSHFQARYVYSGQDLASPIADSVEFRANTATCSVSLTAPIAGCVALAVMTDWGNSSSVPVAQAGSTLDCAIANADIQTSGTVHKDLVASGATTIGFQALTAPGPLGSLIIGVLLRPAVAVPADGVLAATLPVPTVSFTAQAVASGALGAVLPLPIVDFDAETAAAGQLGVLLPVPEVSFEAEAVAAGALGVSLPVPDVLLAADVSVGGQLDLVLPVPDVNLVADVPVSGVLTINLPVPEVSFTGTSASGGQTMGPCGWDIPDPLCSATWADVPAQIQSAARDYAALVLWGATGRQFGLCEITVRPCGWDSCGQNLWNWWGYTWGSGTWVPYIFQGTWFNGCGCAGACSCDPRCQVKLAGDVEEIVEVLIDGIAVDPATYFVNDKTWLVRVGPDCWPQCSDQNGLDTGLQVTYLRGNPVPNALLNAAAILANEWALACQGQECRLSNRVTSLARNGITIDMGNPQDGLDDNLTGIWEVDSVILAINPHKRKQRGRIYAPGQRNQPPRMTTWP